VGPVRERQVSEYSREGRTRAKRPAAGATTAAAKRKLLGGLRRSDKKQKIGHLESEETL
jgi:hypothetical protein